MMNSVAKDLAIKKPEVLRTRGWTKNYICFVVVPVFQVNIGMVSMNISLFYFRSQVCAYNSSIPKVYFHQLIVRFIPSLKEAKFDYCARRYHVIH